MPNDISASKCVILVRAELPAGLSVNAAAVVALTLGQRVPELIGPDVKDADGTVHAGITLIPVPVLTASAERIAEVWSEGNEDPDSVVVGFSDTAQSCRTYDEYITKLGATALGDLVFTSVGLFGPKKRVNKLTGSLPLLR
jgi:hypothetical protein